MFANIHFMSLTSLSKSLKSVLLFNKRTKYQLDTVLITHTGLFCMDVRNDIVPNACQYFFSVQWHTLVFLLYVTIAMLISFYSIVHSSYLKSSLVYHLSMQMWGLALQHTHTLTIHLHYFCFLVILIQGKHLYHKWWIGRPFRCHINIILLETCLFRI